MEKEYFNELLHGYTISEEKFINLPKIYTNTKAFNEGSVSTVPFSDAVNVRF